MHIEGKDSLSEPTVTATPVEKHLDAKGKEVPAWQVAIQKKLWEAKKKRFDDLAKHYNDKLNAMLDMYFSVYSENEEENTESFNIVNKEWMDLANKANSLQKTVKIEHSAFSVNVKNVVESETFKEKLKERFKTAETKEEPNEML